LFRPKPAAPGTAYGRAGAAGKTAILRPVAVQDEKTVGEQDGAAEMGGDFAAVLLGAEGGEPVLRLLPRFPCRDAHRERPVDGPGRDSFRPLGR
jgi:hypothetical protein